MVFYSELRTTEDVRCSKDKRVETDGMLMHTTVYVCV